ncbi:hypothetical protein ONZ45_g3358 [Pleurotus djamor]|nr:hypothetical protein ONZ45_g3358 [Pleurotus djamor]
MCSDVSNLRQLAILILDNVDIIDRLANEQGLSYPNIDTIYDPDAAREKFTVQPEVLTAALLATSAASQLVATLKLPGLSLLGRANAFHVSSALRIASETGVTEILREAGPQGLNVQDIAKKTGAEATILARALRLLATHYIYREVAPNVFANNRISSLTDSGQPSDDVAKWLAAQRQGTSTGHGVTNVQGERYQASSAIPALVHQCTDEVFKASSFLPDVVISNHYSKSAFQRALNFDQSMWEFFEKNPGYLQRIQGAMVAWKSLRPHQTNLKGFEWEKLPKDAVVVDIGGGNGSESFEIARKAPNVQIVVQDRDQTIQAVATPWWNADPVKKKLLESGRVKLEGQDFFEPQPEKLKNNVSVFFLRLITHDWPKAENIKLLKQLRSAASKTTKLVIVDSIVPYACPSPSNLAPVTGTVTKVPSPLLANLGEANADVYTTDFTMAALLNAQERTLGEFNEIIDESGWSIEKIYQTAGSVFSQIVCNVK